MELSVLVTGATGFAGWHAAARLRSSGHRVRALVRDLDKGRRLLSPLGIEDVDLVVGDMTDPDAVARVVTGGYLDAPYLARKPGASRCGRHRGGRRLRHRRSALRIPGFETVASRRPTRLKPLAASGVFRQVIGVESPSTGLIRSIGYP